MKGVLKVEFNREVSTTKDSLEWNYKFDYETDEGKAWIDGLID